MLLYKPNAVLAMRSHSHFFYQCNSGFEMWKKWSLGFNKVQFCYNRGKYLAYAIISLVRFSLSKFWFIYFISANFWAIFFLPKNCTNEIIAPKTIKLNIYGMF